jgi:hypothetical protein
MSSYSMFFDYNNKTYRLPVNPEQIEISSTMAIEKYEILKSGQIAVPTHMELKEYSFEAEFPHEVCHYIEIPNEFKNADYYLVLFEKWRLKQEPVRFIASNGICDDINTLVLMEELTIIEKAGEEADKYIKFKLLEYNPYGKQPAYVVNKRKVKQMSVKNINPKSSGYYVVKLGDSLWAIAKKYYGSGAKYTRIYNANKDKIKNPALIYPGQKLTIPD